MPRARVAPVACPRAPRRIVRVILAACLVLVPARIGAQLMDGPGEVERLIAAGDAAHASLDAATALSTFAAVLEADPEHYGALWRAAREALSLGMLATGEAERKEMYARAESYARRAVDLRPDRIEGHAWLAATLGQTALGEGRRERVRLADEIWREASAALAIDSLDAQANDVLGQWHAEIMRIGGFSRFMARKLLGADSFERAGWDEAVRHLELAVREDPGGLIHRVALARVYLDRDRKEDARAQLEEVLARPERTPTDPLHKREARDLLERAF